MVKIDGKLALVIVAILALYFVIANPNFTLFATTGQCIQGNGYVQYNGQIYYNYCKDTSTKVVQGCSGTTKTTTNVACAGCKGTGSSLTCSGGSTPPPTTPPSCTPSWSCGSWSSCSSSGTQTRTCTDSKNCGTTSGKPATSQSCTPTSTPPSSPTGQCTTDVNCCTSSSCGSKSGYSGLFADQQLKTTACSGNNLIALTYWDWGCPYVNGAGVCQYEVKSGKVLQACANGCEASGGAYGAQCKAAPTCVEGTKEYLSCDSSLPKQEAYRICTNGVWMTTINSCPFVNGVQGTCSGTKCTTSSPTCSNACTAGSKVCDSGNQYSAVCKDWNGDGCTESPSTTQLILCQYGCDPATGDCKSAPPAPQCTTGDYGYPYCSSNKIVQAYRYVSGTSCLSAERTITGGDCTAQNAKCVQSGTGANAASCVKQECATPPATQCSGDKTKILSYSVGTYPNCNVVETVQQTCGTGTQCDATTLSCVSTNPNPLSCAVTNVKPVYIAVSGSGVSGTQAITQSVFPLLSISSISPATKLVKANEPVVVNLRQTVTKACEQPYIHIKAVPRDLVTTQSGVTLEILPPNEMWTSLSTNANACITLHPEGCVNGEEPVDYQVVLSGEQVAIYDVSIDLTCPISQTTIGDSVRITKETDSFSFTVQSGVAPVPVTADKCDQCSGLFCTQSACTGLGACQFIPGKIFGISLPFAGKCEFAKDILNLACTKDTDCPSPRCLHSVTVGDTTFNTESLMSSPKCVNKICTWTNVVNCADTDQVCSEAFGRCESPATYSYCSGTNICDQAKWDGSKWTCNIALRTCKSCVQNIPAETQFSQPSATGIECGTQPALCPNGYVNVPEGEQCDPQGPLFNDPLESGTTIPVLACTRLSSTLYTAGNVKCTSACKYDTSSCTEKSFVCGDGKVNDGTGTGTGNERCDDGNTRNGDGCSATCRIESGWACDLSQPSVCTKTATECTDGTPEGKCNNDKLYCNSNLELVASSKCCTSDETWNSNTKKCEAKQQPDCVSGTDVMRCISGQEQECSSSGFWTPDGVTCAITNPPCTLTGCVQPECTANTDCVIDSTCTPGTTIQGTCTNGECSYPANSTQCQNTCTDNPCAAGCDTSTLPQVCGWIQGATPEFQTYTNRCVATTAEATVVANSFCQNVTGECTEGQTFIFNQCVDTPILIGGVVVIGVLLFALFGGFGGGKSSGGGGGGPQIIRI